MLWVALDRADIRPFTRLLPLCPHLRIPPEITWIADDKDQKVDLVRFGIRDRDVRMFVDTVLFRHYPPGDSPPFLVGMICHEGLFQYIRDKSLTRPQYTQITEIGL